MILEYLFLIKLTYKNSNTKRLLMAQHRKYYINNSSSKQTNFTNETNRKIAVVLLNEDGISKKILPEEHLW
jgi:hypothetical protein